MSTWTRGTKAPVADELDVADLVVTEGVLPPISGRLVRMGPNPVGPVDESYQWFAGTGMAHAIDLDAGHPTRFVNRWVRTPEVSRALGEAPSVASGGEVGDLAQRQCVGAVRVEQSIGDPEHAIAHRLVGCRCRHETTLAETLT